jgi:hypothetical protein
MAELLIPFLLPLVLMLGPLLLERVERWTEDR